MTMFIIGFALGCVVGGIATGMYLVFAYICDLEELRREAHE